MKKKNWKKISAVLLCFFLLLVAIPFAVDSYVVDQAKGNLLFLVDSLGENIAREELISLQEFDGDCILVLGAGLKEDGTPNYMLRDRLDVAITLYHEEAAPKMLLTGDNGRIEYDEVTAMKRYVMERGVPAEDIFLDYAGFSTYESMYRASHIFQVKKAVVVTQEYHQYRALYIGEALGLEVVGVASDQRTYQGQRYRDFRELLARNKDFVFSIFKPEPAYLGESIPIHSVGNAVQV